MSATGATIRVAEYLANRVADAGVGRVFTLTGGGAMFLNDAFGFHPRIAPVYQHHEQACAMAAEAYARIAGRPGVCIVTTGPGGINALNGVFGAWTDSIPMVVLSGQVKRETCLAATPVPGLRQLGDQEAEIVRMAAPIVKVASVVTDPSRIAFEFDRAWHLATTGRPGPVWLDIPIDVQSSMIDPDRLERFVPAPEPIDVRALDARCDAIVERIARAQRPVLMGGTGVRLARAIDPFVALGERLGIPIVTAWTHDLIASDHPLFCGRPGTIGTRAGNFTVQNADLVIVVGSRLNVRQTSYNWSSFASDAHVVQVDIDEAELRKPTYRPDEGVQADARAFCDAMHAALDRRAAPVRVDAGWLAWCRERAVRYPNVTPAQRARTGALNPYVFVEALFGSLDADDIVATGNATACIVAFQTARLERGQRLFSNSGSASMGYDLPAAIGAYYGALDARGRQDRVVCLAGDGSVMLNVQELQTLATNAIPVKLVVLNNGGYLSIRSSQNNFFKRRAGESATSGIGFPDFVKLADAFGIPAVRLEGPDFIEPLRQALDAPGPILIEAVLDPDQGFEPRMSSRQRDDGTIESPRLEDLFPFLSRDELRENLVASDANQP